MIKLAVIVLVVLVGGQFDTGLANLKSIAEK
jgi:hypothetical protein